MKRLALLLLLPSVAMAQQPLALRLEAPSGPVWFGQHVAVTAILRTPIRFAAPPTFPEPPMQGRAIVLPNGTTRPGSERDGGTSYALLQHDYDIFPAADGTLVIGPLRMRVPVGDAAGGTVVTEADGAALRLEVRLPPGTTDPARLVTAPVLRLSVALEGDPAAATPGQAVTRTVTLTAQDSVAMLLPAMPWTAPDGVRVYPDPPRLTDHSERGVLSAARIDRASFVPQVAGTYTLPGAALQWFEPRSGRMQTLAVPPLTIHAVAAAAPQQSWAWFAVAAAALLAALGLWLVLRRRSATAEALAFAALRRACRWRDPAAAMPALLRWVACASPEAATAQQLATQTGVPALATAASALAARRYGPRPAHPPWDGRPLAAAAAQARRALRPRAQRAEPLPALNPPPIQRSAPRLTLPGWAR